MPKRRALCTFSNFIVLKLNTLQNISKALNNNISYEFGKKMCHSKERVKVSFQPIRFRNLGDRFLIHYFMIKSVLSKI